MGFLVIMILNFLYFLKILSVNYKHSLNQKKIHSHLLRKMPLRISLRKVKNHRKIKQKVNKINPNKVKQKSKVSPN